MLKLYGCITLGVALAACAAPQGKLVSHLPSAGNPQSRHSDAVIGADLAYFEKLRRRLGHVPTDEPWLRYHSAKAKAWLDVARAEYHNNDRSAVIENSLAQAERLIAALEQANPRIDAGTPQLPGTERIRADLWQKAARAKRHANFTCVAPTIARLEVQLVWASYELAQAGWRNASPYIQTAEDLGQQLDRQLVGC